VSRRLLAAAVGVFVVAGCAGAGGGGDDSETSPPPAPEPVEELLREVERNRPGVVLRDFVQAAARRDKRRMWERLSASTRRRLGPSLNGFRGDAARALELELAPLGRRHELILSQTITATFAVAAVARRRGQAYEAYAAALRLEGGVWRVELGSPVRISPLRPKPGETVERRTQLAAEVTAGERIVEAGLWLDGLAFPSRGGGQTPSELTMFGETSALARGPHSVVAFASTGTNAAARAWSFRARRT
jgi:hypothetical protein